MPFPDPLAPPVMDSQPSLLAAVQAHPAGAVIARLPPPPPAPTPAADGDTENEQVTPGWVTLSVWPPAVMVAVRGVAPGFGAAA